MGVSVRQVINHPITSNCFIIYDKAAGDDCIIVDPGGKDNGEILQFLYEEHLEPKYIILTHEHFDHCWGVNGLVQRYNIPVVCSVLCAENIQKIKKNCSVFYDNTQSFEIHCDSISVESLNYAMDFNGQKITFYHTPGHTDASISFSIDKYLFTGDTLIKDMKTVTKLPSGSTTKLKESLALYGRMGTDYVVMAGHGDSFQLREYDLNFAL